MTTDSQPAAMEVDGTVEVSSDIMSTLVSLHSQVDAFQLAEFNKARNKTSPGGKLARLFAKADRRHACTPLTLDEMLRHQLEPLPAPLLRSSSAADFHSKAVRSFSHILRFSEDPTLTKDDAMEVAQKLMQLGMQHPEMRDEIYMQLFKQTRFNSNEASRLQLWQLMHLMMATMPPSKDYVALLSHYIHDAANDSKESEELKMKAVKTWHALKRSVRAGARMWLPSIEEIGATMRNARPKVKVYFLDDTHVEVHYDIATTVVEAVDRIAHIIRLDNTQSFSLYECRGWYDKNEEFVLLDDQRYLADVVYDLGEETKGDSRLMFRKRMFRECDEDVTETQFLNLSYIQAQFDFLRGYYPVVQEDVAQLCALQLIAEYGPELLGDEKVLKKAIERFTYRDVRRSLNREEWRAEVLLKCTSLKCPSSELARYAFLSMIRSLPYGCSVFFHVSRLEDPIGLLPPKLGLAVNNRGVHFFRPIPREYLHSVELRDIMQFGSSHRAVFFKMRVAGVLHVFQFETKQGEDICMAVQTHINDIMVKRYASMPVGSMLQPHERSIRAHYDEEEVERLTELQRQLDDATKRQERLIKTQGDLYLERDHATELLQEERRREMKFERTRLEVSERIASLHSEVIRLRAELESLHYTIAPLPPIPPRHRRRRDVGTLVRYFDDLSDRGLENAQAEEMETKKRLNQVRSETRGLEKTTRQMEEMAIKEREKIEEALFDAHSDAQSRLNLEVARIAALQDEVHVARSRLEDVVLEIESLRPRQKEVMELRAMQTEVERRDQVHAEAIAHQKEQLQALERRYKREQTARKKYYNKIEDMKGRIRVFARVRAMLPHEAQREQHYALHFPERATISHYWRRDGGDREYTFDRVFDSSATQEEIFHDTRDLIQCAVDGYNVCIFAYGQTGSGKTYTIYGSANDPGLAPRGIDQLFDVLSVNAEKLRFRVSCYMLELYQDSLRDLLSHHHHEAMKPRLEIKKEANQLVRVNGVTVVDVQSAAELIAMFEAGQRHRRVAATQLNIASSRSHLIMSVVVESTDLQTQALTRGKLSFVDLAGSERVKKSGSVGEQLKEAQAINLSLSALADVISSLARGDAHIPYRNHKLTMLMSDSLGGNAKTLMFVNVSPTDANLDETQNSLQYATRVRAIKNDPVKETDRQIAELKKQLAFWKQTVELGSSDDVVQSMLREFV